MKQLDCITYTELESTSDRNWLLVAAHVLAVGGGLDFVLAQE
jgi:hypothetical protein